MFINRLFREQALARRQRQEPLDDRLQVTAPHEWLLVAGLGVAVDVGSGVAVGVGWPSGGRFWIEQRPLRPSPPT